MQNVLHNSTNTEFAYLINLLQQDTFSGNASFFSFSGRVLVAHKLMEKHKNDFAGIIELIGELDACRSIAQIVKEFTNRSVHYCLADLYQADRPHMKLINFWNPFVDYRKVVTNNIELGGDNKELLVILTGSNTGGKSTVGLKGTLLSLYLAHTIGIAPADTCRASLFNDLCSYLHVLDDTASGQSSFQAEVNRSQALIKAIKALPQDQYAFVVIDELFKGTSPEKGTSGAYKIVKHIAQFDNVMCIVATHFKELTQLEEETDGNCINMKIDVYEDEHGNLVRPHKLEYGVSTQNIADAIMQSHFEDINFDL
jgi:DNA mismatch repair ATPase MutS